MLSIHQISVAYCIPEDDVEFALMAHRSYTIDLKEPCWVGGPKKFRSPSSKKTLNPLRSISALAFADVEYDDRWRLHRQCSTPSCRNPLHYEIKPVWDPTGVQEPKDLPA